MKILVTNYDLNHYAGTETFIYALSVELRRIGHEVICFSPRLGAVAQRLAAAGIAVTGDLSAAPDDVDVIHAHHRYESLLARARYPHCPMLFACHGVLPWQEQPLSTALGITRYVAVSEETRDHLVRRHAVAEREVAIVRNGIDLDRFQARAPVAAHASRALILSNYMPGEQRAQIRRVCRGLGITVREVGARDALWAVEDELNWADLVFGLGRSALEAMACRRLVVVYDYNGGDGLVTPERFELLRRRNFSGRTHARHFTEAELTAEIAAYDPAIAEGVYAFITRDHDVRVMASQLVGLYEEARERAARSPDTARADAIGQYRALTAVLADVAALRAAAASAEGSLQDIWGSRSWQVMGMYRTARAGLRRLRRRPAKPRTPARILVVDDDPLVGQWLTDVLASEGHEVEAVEAARDAVRSRAHRSADAGRGRDRALRGARAHAAPPGPTGDLRLRQHRRAALPALPRRARGPQAGQAVRHQPAHPAGAAEARARRRVTARGPSQDGPGPAPAPSATACRTV
jgi:CheY-like chemotaxis protein